MINRILKGAQKVALLISVFFVSILSTPNIPVLATWNEEHPDTWSTAGSYVYRDGSSTPNVPISIDLNYSAYSNAYDTSTFVTDPTGLFGTISQVEFGMYDTAGALASSGTYRNYVRVSFGNYNSTTRTVVVKTAVVLAGATETTYGGASIVLPQDFQVYPHFMLTFDPYSSSVDIRWGSLNSSIYTNTNSWVTYDGGSATYNTGVRFYSGYSTNGTDPTYTAKTTTTVGSSAVIYTLNQASEIAHQYYDDLIQWTYDKGFREGYADGYPDGQLNPTSSQLLDVFSLIVGVVINVFAIFATLEIFDISIMSILGVVIAFAGIIFILKLMRG